MNVPSLDEIKKFTLLEDIHGATESTGRSFVCPYNVFTDLTPSETDEWVTGMIDEGLLQKDDDMTLKVSLTDHARDLLQRGTSQRYTPSVFRGAVRERLLEWVAEHSSDENDFVEVRMDAQESWFYGREISFSDLEQAADHLEQHGLVASQKTHPDHSLWLSITDSGRNSAAHFDGAAEFH